MTPPTNLARVLEALEESTRSLAQSDINARSLERLQEQVADLHSVIIGSLEKEGLVSRLRCLESSERVRERLLWVIAAALVAILLERLMEVIL